MIKTKVKIVITGAHGSGKFEILDHLSSLGVRCGREFTSSPDIKSMYIDPLCHIYTGDDVEIILESNSYITYFPVDDLNIKGATNYVRGIDLQEWDNNDVFVINPYHILGMNWSQVKDSVVFIWIDNDKSTRYKYYSNRDMKYDFMYEELLEHQCEDEFSNLIYDHHVLYFNNDNINHIIASIYSLVKDPKLLDIYKKLYN